MATITTRSGKGSALTNSEVDANFTNLNTDKVELPDISATTLSPSGIGSLSYDDATGVFTYTPPVLVTGSSTNTFTNKSGNISQWTNDTGYLTSETDSQTLSFSSPDLTISNGNSVDLSAITTGYATESSVTTNTNDISAIESAQTTQDSAIALNTAKVTGADRLPLAGGALTGAVTTNSTIDGRDVSVDGTKLDGIESGATADQTPAQILTAIKTVDGVGSGLDADLLDGQSSAHYATASSAATNASDIAANTSDISAIQSAQTVQDSAIALNTAKVTGADRLLLSGGALTGAVSTTSTIDGRDVSVDGAKLDAIESSATADQTAAEILTAIKTVDGAGSGLDADLLDGQSGSYYTGYTDTAVADLVDSSPATLDTLNELAAALGDDPNFATTVSNSIGTKLSKAGGALTGAVTTNSTIDGRDVSLDGAKLDNIANNANNYVHPSDHSISFIAGLQAALDNKLDDSQVLTNVPANAVFTDTVYTLPFTDNSSNWDTAYGWGNHASAGYLTSYTDTNTTYSIQDGELSQNNFTNADHTKLDGIATSANNYTLPFTDNSTDWNTAYGWGNHASANYLTDVGSELTSLPTDTDASSADLVAYYDVSASRWEKGTISDVALQGPTGATGPAGADGAAGSQGVQGATGAAGTAGADGADGAAGATGATGSQGAQGPAGADGADGSQGVQGIQGATGATGPAGADGNDGADGATGAAGSDGNDGANGAQGIQGIQGIQGETGAAGAAGATGAAGADGNDGAAGSTGAAGSDGATGPQGATGAAGSNGTNGNDGADGAAGADGNDGATGPQGATGAAGADGALNALPLAGGALTGAVTTNSTFDGRDVATDGTKLDGIAASANNYSFPYTVSSNAGNSTVVQRTSAGYIKANYFNTTPNTVTSGVTQVCVETGNDGYIRHGTAAAIRTFLNVANGANAYVLPSTVITNSATQPHSMTIRNGSPTFNFRDTDHRGFQLHCNANLLYMLNANAADGASWATVNGHWAFYINSTNNNANFGGSITAIGNITAYSDERIKNNIETIDGALEKVCKMRGIYYNRNDLGEKENAVRRTGVIAQEIEKVLPEVVRENEEKDVDDSGNTLEGGRKRLTVDYGNIVGVLIEAIKEQQVQIDELKKTLEEIS